MSPQARDRSEGRRAPPATAAQPSVLPSNALDEGVNASLLLDEQLCFALYAASNQAIRAYREPLARLGLTYLQYLALLVLWQHGPQMVRGISERLALESSTLTPLLKRLEAASLITRTRDAKDERALRVALTPLGEALREPVAAVQREVARCTRLSRSDFVQLRDRLWQLTTVMSGKPD